MDDIKKQAAAHHNDAARHLEIAAGMHRDAAKQCESGNFEKAQHLATEAAETDTAANHHAMQAIESTARGGGRIEIATRARGDEVILEVADDGCGIVERTLTAVGASPATAAVRSFVLNWRRRRDSNPRYALRAYNGLANRRLQPLGHISAGAPYAPDQPGWQARMRRTYAGRVSA